MTRALPLLGALLAALAGPAMAHASFEAPEAEAGSTYKSILRVERGCDASRPTWSACGSRTGS